MRAPLILEKASMWFPPRPPVPTMATRMSSLAPKTRREEEARIMPALAAAVVERKRLRVIRDIAGLPFYGLRGPRTCRRIIPKGAGMCCVNRGWENVIAGLAGGGAAGGVVFCRGGGFLGGGGGGGGAGGGGVGGGGGGEPRGAGGR